MNVPAFKARVAALYGEHVLSKSALRIRGGGGVFDRVLSAGRYGTVLEIGTHRGMTAGYLAQFCERVITVDLRFGRLERYGTPFDRQAFWERLGLRNIDLILLDAPDDLASAIAEIDFDLAFIDGDHNRPAKDFALVCRCGAVLLHDYAPDNAVGALVRSLPHHEVEIMDGLFAFWRAAA